MPKIISDILEDPEALERLQCETRRLVASARADSQRWFPEASDLITLSLALCGEVGEVANLVKKVARGTDTYEEIEDKLRSEIADVFTYLLALCGSQDIDLIVEYREKQAFNERRFGHGRNR